MVFGSALFLFAFLPLFLACYYLAPLRFRNTVAVLSSMLFYAWGAPRFLFVLLGVALIDFTISHRLHNTSAPPSRRRWLTFSLAINLALLAFFKYTNFAVHEINQLLVAIGCDEAHWKEIALPLGISFFTFHKISYMVDVYRGVALPPRSFQTYLLYLLFFPQLIAGPIIRYHEIAGQLLYRRHSIARFMDGINRFCFGLAKKILIANPLGETAARVFDGRFDAMPPSFAWLGLFAYTLQIYFDFSGYSDMAIGLAKMTGIDFPENFNRPYLARNFTDFWRRWHISLSNVMREYLYIPLGGNRCSRLRAYVNLWIVFLLSGLWHGAAWQFIAWGAYHGFFLSLDKVFRDRGPATASRLPGIVSIPLTFFLVSLGWVLFRAHDLSFAMDYMARLFAISTNTLPSPPLAQVISLRAEWMLIIGLCLVFLPAFPGFPRLIPSKPDLIRTASFALAIVLLLLASCSLINATFNPFIYFRF